MRKVVNKWLIITLRGSSRIKRVAPFIDAS